jgi:hypothetical protein
MRSDAIAPNMDSGRYHSSYNKENAQSQASFPTWTWSSTKRLVRVSSERVFGCNLSSVAVFQGSYNDSFTHCFDMKSNKRKYVDEEDVRSPRPVSKRQRLRDSFKSKNSQCRVKEADPLEKEDTSRSMSSDAIAPNRTTRIIF